jgi:predicted kinase
MVWAIAKYMVRALFEAGHEQVVLDATNLTEWRRREWRNRPQWETVYKEFNTDAETCALRAYENNQVDLLPVISRMNAHREPLTADERLRIYDKP